MKKLRSIPHDRFLKLLFAFCAAMFLLAAVAVRDRASMFTGLWKIISQPCPFPTNLFALGGYSATLLNMGLIAALALALYSLPEARLTGKSATIFFLAVGFSGWGVNVLNVWPMAMGAALYCLLKKLPLSQRADTLLLSTAVAPLISELMLRYPSDQVGLTFVGVFLALIVGGVMGFLLCMLPLENQDTPYHGLVGVGVLSMLVLAVLYTAPGIALPTANANTLDIASRGITEVFCGLLFSIMVVAGFFMDFNAKEYWALVKAPGKKDMLAAYGNAGALMSAGVFGLFVLAYYDLIGATFNSITFGAVFCMLGFFACGAHLGNAWPVIAGYVLSGFGCWLVSKLIGSDLAAAPDTQIMVVGLCFAGGFSGIADCCGRWTGLAAGALSYLVFSALPNSLTCLCLCTGGMVCWLIWLMLTHLLSRRGKAVSAE